MFSQPRFKCKRAGTGVAFRTFDDVLKPMNKGGVPVAHRDFSTVVTVFDTRGQAEAAIDELHHARFAHEQIGIVSPGGRVADARTPTERVEDKAANGAVSGAITGGAVGAVAGALAVGLIPGIGPAVAGGILTGIILGGATGAAAGSYLGPFIALGLSEDELRHVQCELKAGRTIVAVKAEERVAEATTILHSHGGYQVSAFSSPPVGAGTR
jgi:hypothetical protein